MKYYKLLFLAMSLLIIVSGCSSDTSKNTNQKTQSTHTQSKVDPQFLKDVKTFQTNIKNAMDDTVLNNVEKDLGSLTQDEYDKQIDFLFGKYNIDDLNEDEAKLYSACNQSTIDYLQYGKQMLLGDNDKANYALDNFKQDMDKLDKLIEQN